MCIFVCGDFSDYILFLVYLIHTIFMTESPNTKFVVLCLSSMIWVWQDMTRGVRLCIMDHRHTEGVLRREHCQIVQNLGNHVMKSRELDHQTVQKVKGRKSYKKNMRMNLSGIWCCFSAIGQDSLPCAETTGRCDLGSRTLSKRTGKEVEKSGIPSTLVENRWNLENW